MHIAVLVAALFLSPVTSSLGHAAGDATRGEQVYESRCMACHSLDANRVGPMHRGVYGRVRTRFCLFGGTHILANCMVGHHPQSLAHRP